MRVWLTLLVLSVVSAQASGAETSKWIAVSDNAAAAMAFDANDIEIIGDQRTVWARTVFATPTRVGARDAVTRLVSRTAFDCRAHTYEIKTGQVYVANEELPVAMEPLGPMPVGANSLGAQLMDAVCAYRVVR